ncbi:MAG: META domain-containing protein [Agriterribacter sp.]
MKNLYVLGAVMGIILLVACESSKKNSGTASGDTSLNGTWELNYITGPRIAFEGLYPGRKPVITFNTADTSFSGNTSCNNFRGRLISEGNNISFTNDIAMTKMFCEGQGENVFIETLKKVNRFSVTNDTTLTFIMGDVAMMRFSKK